MSLHRINFNPHIYSELTLAHPLVTRPGEWALNISKALSAKGYINPIFG